jgi:Flp pilus assembly protein TadD/outer membrane protein OmpA-like peptidoglycan-associated protein
MDMKRIYVLGFAVLIAAMMTSCGFGKMVTKYPEVSVTLDNPDLENKGGQVAYTIKGTFPPKYMKKKAVVTMSPTLKVDGTNLSTPFTTIKLKGEKAKGDGTVISWKKGGSFTQSGTFKFDPSYEDAEIVAPAIAQIKKKSTTLNPEKTLGEGISNTSSRIGLQPKSTYEATSGNFIHSPHNFTPEYIGKTATIYFDLNSSNMNWSNKNNKSQAAKDSIKAFTDFLYNDNIIDRVVISGWASPEGEESNNQGLSERRFEQGKKWFQDQFEKYLKDYAKKNKIKLKDLQRPEFQYVNNAKGEDWDGFEAAIEKSNIAQKNQILNVVRSQASNDMREQKIREMTDIYPEIADAILPPLRRAEMQLICKKHETYTDAELVSRVKSNPNDFSINERLYAASVATSVEDQETIYKALIRDPKTQGDWRAYNDLGVLYLNNYYNNGSEKDLEDAISNFNKAAAISPDNGIVLNNLAVAEFLQGNHDAARANFEASQKAAVSPVSQSYALGMYSILDGDYNKAAQMIGGVSCDYNTALVQLLNKDYPTAKATLDCIENVDAKTAYLKAVLAARMKDENGVYSNLATAVQLDPSYKKTAKKDAEFKKYKRTETFKNIVK